MRAAGIEALDQMGCVELVFHGAIGRNEGSPLAAEVEVRIEQIERPRACCPREGGTRVVGQRASRLQDVFSHDGFSGCDIHGSSIRVSIGGGFGGLSNAWPPARFSHDTRAVFALFWASKVRAVVFRERAWLYLDFALLRASAIFQSAMVERQRVRAFAAKPCERGPMIEYFRATGDTRSLVKLDAEEHGCWIALFEPTFEELRAVSERFSIDQDDLMAPLDPEEVSRVERNENYTMFIVDTPVRDETPGAYGYKTIPIGVFETPHHVISVCSMYRIPIIALLKRQRNLHDTAEVRKFTSDMLLASSSAYFTSLQVLNRRRMRLEQDMEHPTRKDLEELFDLDESFVYLTTSLATNDMMLERYRRYVLLSADEEVRELFDDVIIENRQALETTRIYSQILDSTIQHFSMTIDQDLNRTMQLVATITLVLCVPTIVGGFFGMNLEGIPLADSPYGFAIVTGVTAVLLVALLALLKKLKWF